MASIKKFIEDRFFASYLWLHGLISNFIVGFATVFEAMAGGFTVGTGVVAAQQATTLPETGAAAVAHAAAVVAPLTLKMLLICSAWGGVKKGMQFLKDNPTAELVTKKTLEKRTPPKDLPKELPQPPAPISPPVNTPPVEP